MKNLKAKPHAGSKLFNLGQDNQSKKWFFWSNLYKTEIMRASLIEMLQLSKFGHMIISTSKFDSYDKFSGGVKDRIYDVITLLSTYFSFKKA